MPEKTTAGVVLMVPCFDRCGSRGCGSDVVVDDHRRVVGPSLVVGVGAVDASSPDARGERRRWRAGSRCASRRRCRTPARATTTSVYGPATSGCMTRTTSTQPVASRSVSHCRSAGGTRLSSGWPSTPSCRSRCAHVPVAADHRVARRVPQHRHPLGDRRHEPFLLPLPLGIGLTRGEVDARDGQVPDVDLEVSPMRKRTRRHRVR